MISRQEIMDFSREFGLAPNVIEKDYALGWVLAGISNTEGLSTVWVFKGGTALKKCFFETYRFSEDLDFTVTDEKYLDLDSLTRYFARLLIGYMNRQALRFIEIQYALEAILIHGERPLFRDASAIEGL